MLLRPTDVPRQSRTKSQLGEYTRGALEQSNVLRHRSIPRMRSGEMIEKEVQEIVSDMEHAQAE